MDTFLPTRYVEGAVSTNTVSDNDGVDFVGTGTDYLGETFSVPPEWPEGITVNHISAVDVSGFASYILRSELSMTEKIVILSTMLSDRATLSASTEEGSLVVENVLDQDVGNVWRTTSAINQYVNIELPRAEILNMAAFTFWHDGFSSSALWRVKLYATQADMIADTNSVVDTDWTPVWPDSYKHNDPDWGPDVAILRWDNEEARRYARISFTDPGSADGYLDIARLAIGKRTQFLMNPKHEGGLGYVANDVQEPNGYGQVFTDPRPYAQRQFDLAWSALGDQEMKQDISELSRQLGQASDFYVFLNPAAIEDFHKLSMQAIFENTHRFVPIPSYVTDKDGVGRMGWSFNSTMIQKL